jgi:hypothetical protein
MKLKSKLDLFPPLWLYSPLYLGRLFSFLILYTVGRTPWTGGQPVVRPLPTHTTTQTQNKPTQTSMARVGFERTILAFERAKTVHTLDCQATALVFSGQTFHHHHHHHHHHWQKSPFWAIAFIKKFCQIASCFQVFEFHNNNCFTEQGCQPCAQPPTWRTRSLP